MSDTLANKFKRKLSAKNITAIILFGAIILVFVLFGFQSRMGGGSFGAAAMVNGSFISFGDFQGAVDRIEQMYAQFGGGRNFDPEQQRQIREQALRQLVDEELIAQAARKEGIKATDEELKAVITKDIPAFQKDGFFQREYYQNYLGSQNISAGEFENRIRKQLESIRLRRLFESSSHTLTIESEKQKFLQNYKMNLLFAKLDEDRPETSSVSTTEALKALEDSAFAKRVENEFELKKAQLSQKEQVRAQHILIMSKPNDPASDKKALDKINDLKKKAGTEDFGTLAQKNSEDPGSKSKKGDLGFFGRGAMVPEFENVAFSLEPGKVSDPVKSPFGYHLIKVLEKKAAKDASFDDHKVRLAQETLAREKIQKKTQEIETLLSSKPNEVEAEIQKLGLKWEETGLFNIGADQVPKISGLETEKLSTMTPKDPFMKTMVKVGNARYILKLKEIKQDNTELAPTSLEAIQRRRADAIYSSWLNDFRKRSDIETNSIVLQ